LPAAIGRRQILTFLVPGDTSDLHGFLITTTDHSISTLMPSRIATIQWEIAIGVAAEHPRLRAALGFSALQEDGIMRERMVSLGRRSARGRTAYLLCELVWRQRAAGLSEDHAIRLPLTQIDLGDALGLTPVAVNRALQDFRRNGWITLERRRLALLAIERLMEIASLIRIIFIWTAGRSRSGAISIGSAAWAHDADALASRHRPKFRV
jgi:CRP-like cAMP-binding protein